MHRFPRLTGLLVCAAMIASAGCAANTPVAPLTTSPSAATSLHARTYRPHYMPTRWAVRPAVQPAMGLTYGGGRLLYKPKMYLTFWGYKGAGDPNRVAALLGAYAKAVGGSKLDNVVTQYAGTSGNIANPRAQLGGTWTDPAKIPPHPTDAQVAAEAIRAVAHFGYDANGAYFIATGHDHSTTGFGSQFCSYHSSTTTSGNPVAYVNFPYIPDGGSPCGADVIAPPNDETGANEGVTIIAGHEYAEAVTDPDPFGGWNSPQGEIGDRCAWTDIENDPFKKNSYSAQPEYSNATESCVHTYP